MRSIQGPSPQVFSGRNLLELPCGAAVTESNLGSRTEAVAFLPRIPLLPPKLRTLPLATLALKKECASLGSATASFCCRNSTGTLEHETQDSKESYHGNCGKQVGE